MKNPLKTQNLSFELIAAIKSGDPKLVWLILKKKKAPHHSRILGDDEKSGSETPLMTAAGRGFFEIVSLLCEDGADVNAKDTSGNTALDYAASENKVEVVNALIARGADLHSKNNLNWNALMQAAFKGRYESAEILLKADVSHQEIDLEKGASTLSLAKFSGNQKLVALLERHGAKERTIRERKPGEPYFLIADCDICTYLPHFPVELTHAYTPEEIPGLEIVHEGGSTDYKAEETVLIKKCRHCGTYYNHYHFIDTEDSIGGAGPICQHKFSRISLLEIDSRLEKLGKKDELLESRARYPGVVDAFTQRCKARHAFMPYIQPYVVETLADFFAMNDDWDSIKSLLLGHPEPGFVEATRKRLLLVAEITLSGGESSLSISQETLVQKIRKLVRDHEAELGSPQKS